MDLAGNTITSIELVITQLTFSHDGTTARLEHNAQWQINGTPLNSVPEPITAALGLMGLGVLGYTTTRRRVA